MYAVYMYVKDDKTVYVGKTNTSIQSRIWAHEKEELFEPYRDAEIYYAELRNSAETTIFETLLINNLCPILNAAMNYENSRYIEIDESILEWKKYTGRRTRAIPDGERAVALALKYWRMSEEERAKEKAKHTFPRKTQNKNHVYGSGSFCETNRNGRKYIRFAKSVNGKRKDFYGKTKEEAYSKYEKYIKSINP